jgi:hypothetical protein
MHYFCVDVTLQNWLQISPDTWPPSEGITNEIFIYHGGALKRSFGLSQELIDWRQVDFVSLPELSFKYWSSSDLGRFRAISSMSKEPQDLLLNQTKQWTSASMLRLSAEAWKSVHFITGDENYLLAFKNIQGNAFYYNFPFINFYTFLKQ